MTSTYPFSQMRPPHLVAASSLYEHERHLYMRHLYELVRASHEREAEKKVSGDKEGRG